MKKKCIKCGRIKDVGKFGKGNDGDGLRYTCKFCDKQHRENNKKAKTIYDKLYWKQHKEKRIKQHQIYRENNKEKIIEKSKLWYQKNKKQIFKKKKQYYRDNKIIIVEKRKRYCKNNKELISACGKRYDKSNAKYISFFSQLTVDELSKLSNDGVSLEVKCRYCGKYFKPSNRDVQKRINALNGHAGGDQYLYCSNNCKTACPVYRMRKYPKGFKHTTSREVSTYLRQMVLERDNWTCQICGKTSKEAQLHCHHMDPATQNPMFQNDMDSCVTLCKCCHTFVHKQRGCRYIDLRCNRETDYTKKFKEEIRLKSINSQE